MAETSVRGAVRRESSGDDRPNRAKRNRIDPPPLSRRDLISDLPDAVIHHIFSFLPLEDVVKTGVLSKRWRSTWTTTTHLVFNELRPRHRGTYYPDFPSLVDSVLSRCTSPAVKRFHITFFKCDEAYRPKLELWLRFAEERRVEDLRLCLHQQKVRYELPRFLYGLSRLVRLEVRGCRFSLGTAVRWPCLKFLLLACAELSDDILEGIVRGSPVLESLALRYCRGVKNIIIDSTSVKELILANRGGLSESENIWAPHLLSLRVSGIWGLDSLLRLDDVSSLVEAELGFVLWGDKSRHLLKELLEKLRRVSIITIGSWFLQSILTTFYNGNGWIFSETSVEMEEVSFPLSKCQNLMPREPVSQWKPHGIAYMLRSSQCLEKLVIHLTHSHQLMGTHVQFKLDEESIERLNEDLLSQKGNFQCLAKHLKRVEIIGFANSFGSKHLLALIKFLLGDALTLEKMILKADFHAQCGQKHLEAADLSKLLGVSRNVLSYRRASQNAEVIFDYPLEELSLKKHMKKIQVSELG